MDKLVEQEAAPRVSLAAAPALAVQFFLIPLAVVAVTALVYVGFQSLVSDERNAQDYLSDIRHGGTNRRWPAAYELSRLMDDARVRKDPALAAGLVRAFADSKTDDPRVRRYLALALGRLDPPLPPDARALLLEALDDPDSETRISAIWALGSVGDADVVPRLQAGYESDDPGMRKMIVYALGALPGEQQLRTLKTALSDPAPDVRWNAAVALARHGQRDGVSVLAQMLDRGYVEQSVKRVVRSDADVDPVGEVMISGLNAIGALKEHTLKEPVSELSRRDRSLRVRQAALVALKQLGA